MITDLDLVNLCASLYDSSQDSTWDKIWKIDGAYAAVKHFPDASVVVWRGTKTAKEWLEDLTETPIEVAGLGHVHLGFWVGVSQIAHEIEDELRRANKPKIIVTGHSLGAARAVLFAAKLKVQDGFQNVEWVSFAMPRPGFRTLAEVAVGGHWYRNGEDAPVTHVPYLLGLYKHPGSMFQINEPGQGSGPFSEHHIELYQAGVAKLVNAAAA